MGNGVKIGTSQVIKNNLNPKWTDEVFEIEDFPKDVRTDPAELILEMYDLDGPLQGDFLGMIDLSGTELLDPTYEAITWFDLQKKAGAKEQVNKYVQGRLAFSLKRVFL